MILIADGGSTKSAWTMVDENKNRLGEFRTDGYNPYFWKTDEIINSMKAQMPEMDIQDITKVFFYGAGCSTAEKKTIVQRAMDLCFPYATVHINHDLLAAARALLKRERGFAAILGTGTNTCLYDGYDISLNIDSLGHVLGDEGSGSYIGRKLVRDFMRSYFPAELQKGFAEKFGYTNNEQIFDDLYKKPYPNRTLASYCGFAADHADHEYIRTIVKDSFGDFFKNLVSHYPGYKLYRFNCVGSVGFGFKDILAEVAQEYGMQPGTIIKAPIDALVEFHLQYGG
jgi:glucosamine kinase